LDRTSPHQIAHSSFAALPILCYTTSSNWSGTDGLCRPMLSEGASRVKPEAIGKPDWKPREVFEL
jgi:hypothetical protein